MSNKIEFTNDTWDYRIVRSNKEDGTPADWYSIQEIYYDEETGKPMAQSIDLQVEGENKEEIKKQLQDMLIALDKDTISEIKQNESDINKVTPQNLEIVPNTDNGNIFESPDGGNTVYRRNFGETERELVKENITTESDNLNQRVLNLEIENSDLKDMLREQGVDIV
jgi:hypothetical protein